MLFRKWRAGWDRVSGGRLIRVWPHSSKALELVTPCRRGFSSSLFGWCFWKICVSGRSERSLASGENVKWWINDRKSVIWECFWNLPPPHPLLHVPWGGSVQSPLWVCETSGKAVRMDQMEASPRQAWDPLFSSYSRAGHSTNCYTCRPHLCCFYFLNRIFNIASCQSSALN